MQRQIYYTLPVNTILAARFVPIYSGVHLPE